MKLGPVFLGPKTGLHGRRCIERRKWCGDISMEDIERVTEREVANVSCNEHLQASTLITGIKDKPRNRVDSGFMRTQWVKGDMKKRKKDTEVP
ncbi:hypothetical protein MTR_3g462550 [Medicago truncatula]|uniref:Uncharacterized protein n=1 Tax=Medicago truncatula TaxID=3880 RepID=A0A072UX39_MEDTR|nr:hypothetical protein MTR_3g462550 [Medicago truncatula]